jgi:hypothetical protein
MHGPTCIFWANLTPFSPKVCPQLAPAAPLFWAEAAEGSSNNKYLELYNPTDAAVDLNDYAFANSNNGATVDGVYDYWNAFTTDAVIQPGGIYMICHPSADASILEACTANGQTHAYLSNGDDGYCLVNGAQDSYEVLDCIGDWSVTDPGSGWDVCGAGSTKDGTLIRNCDVTGGEPNWGVSGAAATCEWTVAAKDDWAGRGVHCPPAPPPAAVPGCGVAPLTATECTAECAGLAFVADAGICTGCQTDGTTVIDDTNVASLVPPAEMCP